MIDVLPDWNVMDRGTAGIIAQLVPVLMLSLLFEARLRSPKRSALGLFLGFLGNLSIAVAAIVLEFGVLGTAQHSHGSQDARWMWLILVVLFAGVLLRWVATSTAIRAAASSEYVRQILTAGLASFEVARDFWTVLFQVVAAPSEVLAVGVRSLGQGLVAIGTSAALAFRDVARGLVSAFHSIAEGLRAAFRRR
ncbi:hypothetical protein [Leifsonia sp. 21MFCrub1.1]|uniref:hypothetical protein n=1 Tax=Leifsonia sp. 21MFCrub1.1 TaxID=1798223 RepID=UPI0012FE3C1B|nr:hypothetical protein [Leifsonia sp. 21MFCrub1.1]